MDRCILLLMLLLMKITSSNGQDTSFMEPCINCDPEKEVCSYIDDSGNVIECPQISERKFTISKDSRSKYDVGNGTILEKKKHDSQKPFTQKEDDQNKQPNTKIPELKTAQPSSKKNRENLSEVPKTRKEALLKSSNVEKTLPEIGNEVGKQLFLQKDFGQSEEPRSSAINEQKEEQQTGENTHVDLKKDREIEVHEDSGKLYAAAAKVPDTVKGTDVKTIMPKIKDAAIVNAKQSTDEIAKKLLEKENDRRISENNLNSFQQDKEPSTKEKQETNIAENSSIKQTSKPDEELMFQDALAPEKADESGGPIMEKILTKEQRIESLKDAKAEKDTKKEDDAKPTDGVDERSSSFEKMTGFKRLTNLNGANIEKNNEKVKEETRKDQETHDLFDGSSSSSSSSSGSSQSSEETGRRCPVGQIFDRKSRICKILANLQCRIDARNRNWQQLLRTDNNGNPLSGAKADLLEAARKGSRIKIRTSTYSAEVQNCRIINQDICCQGLLHGSYQTWEMFQSNVYWWMINVCTTGNWHMVRYFVGGGYLSQTKTRGSFMWYALRNNDGSYPEPLLSTDSSGMILSGTNRRVKRAVKDGKSLSVVQKNLFLIPIQNIQLKQRTVSAQHVWSVSQRIAGNHIEFQSNAYWWFNLLTNLGSRDMSRWSLGFHTSRSQTNDVVAMDWFAGDCWMKAFTTSAGLSQPLARLFLRSKVEAGLPIKVKVGSMYREVDNVMVSGNHISAQIISQLAREDVDTFASDLNWEFSTLSTRGVVRTYRPLVGSSSMAPDGVTKTSQDITWYFDSRKWDLLFHVSDTGTTLSGSALAVRNAVEQGADIRVGYRQAGDPGFRFSTADNINFGPSPDLSVQAMRHLRDNNIPGDEFDFGNELVWSFLLLNTKGFIRKTDWIVGEHVNDGRSMERAEIKFFVNL